jgi:hypothetical protein
MRRERPTVVVVFAILNMVLGGLGMLCYLCGGLALAFAMSIPMPGPGGAPGPNILEEMFDFMEKELPGYTAYTIATTVIGLLLSIVLIVSGIGLLGMRRWARWLCIFFSVAVVIIAIGGLVFTIGYVQPAMERWQHHVQEAAGRNARGGMAPGSFSTSPMVNSFSSILGALIEIAYAVGLLVVMFLPTVSAAFAGRPIRRQADEAYDDDEDDQDDYDDRRRPGRDRPGGGE